MIKYKCTLCGATLQTDDSLSGRSEACPACGQANSVPLSKGDLTERKRRQKAEKRRQAEEEARALQEQRRAAMAKEAVATAPVPVPPTVTEAPPAPAEATVPSMGTLTETAFRVIGGVYVAFGILVGIGLILASLAAEKSFLGGSFLAGCLFAIVAVLVGFLFGMPFFAIHLALRYLRRIMNAVESNVH